MPQAQSLRPDARRRRCFPAPRKPHRVSSGWSEKDDPKEWLFPKGHIELGEDHGTAALREVREETGVVAQLVCLLDQVEYKVADKEVRAKYYLMHALYEEEPAEARPSNGSPSPRLTAC